MSCLLRIHQARKDLTKTEIRIADYIENHRDKVINYSCQLLAEETVASPAAVVRFAKKIGYKGYMNLKVDLAQDIQNDRVRTDNIVREDDSFPVLVEKAKNSTMDALEKTYQLLNVDSISQAIIVLRKARRVYLLGIGGSSVVCADLHQKLLRVNVDSRFEPDYHIQLSTLNSINHEDVCLAFTYSGETEEIIYGMEFAKRKGAKIISVSRFGRNPAQKLSDFPLHIPQTEREFRLGTILSRYCLFAVADILYYGMIQDSLDNKLQSIVSSRDLIVGLKNENLN